MMENLDVSYLRVSTASQRDAETIETQRHALARYFEQQGINPQLQFEDDGVSGGIEIHKRPKGSELYRLVSTGQVRRLFVFSLDRIGRDTIDGLLFLRLAESRGTQIVGISDGTDTTREGSTLETELKTVISAQYKRDCTSRTKAGLRRRASEGKISTRAPFGYTVEAGQLVIDEVKAEILRRAFVRAARGDRTREIVRWLNESCAPSPRGKGWRHDTFIYLLKNRVYAGEFVSFGTPRRRPGGGSRIRRDATEQIIIPCPAIVTKELFEAVQARLTFNRKWCATSRKNFYLLKSLVRCGKCGRAYVGHTIGGRRYKDKRYADIAYYECGTVTNRDYQFCGNARVNAGRLEAVIWQQIEAFISSPSKIIERLKECYNRQAASGDLTVEGRWKRVVDQKTKNREARERLTLAVARGVVTDEDAMRARETLGREFASLEKEGIELNDARNENDSQRKRLLDVQDLLTALRERLHEGFSPQKRSEIARCLVRQAIVSKSATGRAEVAVQYVFPAPGFSTVGLAFKDSSLKK
ncbi:MAG: recombinase family protein [Acidobacteriota bacterium]|nr:recombinase family protein [Acidobacteriota bacterium]